MLATYRRLRLLPAGRRDRRAAGLGADVGLSGVPWSSRYRDSAAARSVDGRENWRPSSRKDNWVFKVKEGVKEVRFGDLGWRLNYARDAINSYFVFKTLREKGEVPKGMRFQICIPMPMSGIATFFRTPGDYARVAPGFEEALKAELKTIFEHIPAQDIAIQWDCCSEVLRFEGLGGHRPDTSDFDIIVDPFKRLSRDIPEEAWLGFHFCYGTLGGWPMLAPKDLGVCVRFSNAAIALSGRRVDFVHVPVPKDRDDDGFFAPLREITSQDVKVYIGLIHHDDSPASIGQRIAAAQRNFSDFGLASVCGFGRMPANAARSYIDVHRQAAEVLQEMKAAA